MSFQKCPICNGTGDDPFMLELPRQNYPCPTCKGTRIIHEVTGLPPVTEEKHNVFESFVSMRHTITPTQKSTQHGSNISIQESPIQES